jgi:hypothetical protein
MTGGPDDICRDVGIKPCHRASWEMCEFVVTYGGLLVSLSRT